MPKRTSRDQSAEAKAERSGTQETSRAAESAPVLKRTLSDIAEEELNNERALDAAAGVTQTTAHLTIAPPTAFEVARRNAIEKLFENARDTRSREQLLYALGASGLPLDQRFFTEFEDEKEIIDLAYKLAVRRLVVAVVQSSTTDAQLLAAVRVLARLSGKLDSDEEEPAATPAPAAAKPSTVAPELLAALSRTKSA